MSTTRCRYAEKGRKRWGLKNPDREGEYLGLVRGHDDLCKVRWDGLAPTTIYTYHIDFIEIIQPEPRA